MAMYDRLKYENRTNDLPPRDRDSLERWLTSLTADGWNLVARDGDRTVGHVGVAPTGAADPEFVVFVDDDYQGHGIGTELVKQVVAYAAERGHDVLKLHVERSNERAISVYENIAFDVHEEDVLTLGMHLSLDDEVADEVRRPPAER